MIRLRVTTPEQRMVAEEVRSRMGGGVHPRTGKPVLQNRDGSISTERTITVEMGGRHYVIPTIIGGKVFTPDAAVLMFKAGKNKPVGEFGSAAEADEFARRRSQELGR